MSRTRKILTALPSALGRAAPRLSQLTSAELGLLLQAPLALPAVAWALQRHGLAALQRRLLGEPVGPPATPVTAAERLAAQRVAWCVMVAAAYGPWPANCLQRSVVLCWFLQRRGLRGELKMGVRQGDDGTLDFHSWVEHDGRVLNDVADVRQRYATFVPAAQPA